MLDANDRIKKYFESFMTINNYFFGEDEKDFADAIINSHKRQRWLIDLLMDSMKEYEKVPRWIRKIFGCVI